MRKFFLLAMFIPILQVTSAQNNNPKNQRLKIFMDCSNTWCDMTFIQSEINIVDFYLDNKAADLHILITQQGTGSGGSEYQLIYFGQNRFRNQTDTIRFTTDPNATEFEVRDLFIKYLKLGLAPFIAKSASVAGVKIEMKQADNMGEKKDSSTIATKDPWNYWVFRIGANGNLNADANYNSLRFSGNFSANRTTDDIKINLSFYGSKNKEKYEYETTQGIEKFTVNNDEYGLNHYLIKSLNSHWSYGYEANLSSSTFSNNKRRISFETGVEYDVFPYKDVNTRYFTISYTIDLRNNAYYDSTIYDKLKESLLGHGVDVNISFNQKWGKTAVGVSYHNYFKNWKYFSLGVSGFIDIRISGGLSFNVFAFGGLTRDQLFIPKGGATPQEVLTRRRQLASNYNYYTSFGFNYRFGSKLSNFVNPRFEGGGGGMFF